MTGQLNESYLDQNTQNISNIIHSSASDVKHEKTRARKERSSVWKIAVSSNNQRSWCTNTWLEGVCDKKILVTPTPSKFKSIYHYLLPRVERPRDERLVQPRRPIAFTVVPLSACRGPSAGRRRHDSGKRGAARTRHGDRHTGRTWPKTQRKWMPECVSHRGNLAGNREVLFWQCDRRAASAMSSTAARPWAKPCSADTRPSTA